MNSLYQTISMVKSPKRKTVSLICPVCGMQMKVPQPPFGLRLRIIACGGLGPSQLTPNFAEPVHRHTLAVGSELPSSPPLDLRGKSWPSPTEIVALLEAKEGVVNG